MYDFGKFLNNWPYELWMFEFCFRAKPSVSSPTKTLNTPINQVIHSEGIVGFE